MTQLRAVNIPTFITNNTTANDITSAGGNFGNIIFWHAVYKYLKDAEYTGIHPTWPRAEALSTETQPEKYFDIQANLIDERANHTSLEQIRYNIDVVRNINAKENHLLSIGAQHPGFNNMELSDIFKDTLAEYLSLFKTINLRGDFTRQVLLHNNINHPSITVNGCPSAYLLKDFSPGINGYPTLYNEPKIYRPILDTETSKIIFNSPTNSIQAADESYMWDWMHNLVEYDGIEILSQVPNETETLPIPTSFYNWVSILSNCDFVIGSRIHGSIMALAVNKPCLCIAIDSRTLELCKKLSVPYVDYTKSHIREQLKSIHTKNDLVNYINANVRIDVEKIKSTGKVMESYLMSIIN